MSKDSYWFKHDSTAGRGLRMRKMAHIYGHWGKGVYWDVIEILRDQANYCFDYDDSSLQMLCDLIGCKDEQKFISWMRDCIKIDLFQIEGDKFYSAILCENMSKWEIKKRNGSEPKSETEAKRKHKIREEKIREEKIIEEKKIEEKSTTPAESEFLDYCKSVLNGKYQQLEFSLRAKYAQWVSDKWVDGHGNKIKNWKTKILNTIPHLKPEHSFRGQGSIADKYKPKNLQ